MRTRRFFIDAELILFFKSHILSYIEYRTPAVFHAATSTLNEIDDILTRFLRKIGISQDDAFMYFNLAPLRLRREISILGLIHRTVLGKGPSHFRQFFERDYSVPAFRSARRHNKQLLDIRNSPRSLNIARHSPLGMASIYNLLPQNVVDIKSVSKFQRALTNIVRGRVLGSDHLAYDIVNPRLPLAHHPLICR